MCRPIQNPIKNQVTVLPKQYAVLICQNISNSALKGNILEDFRHSTVSKKYTQYRALFEIFTQLKKMYENLAIFFWDFS